MHKSSQFQHFKCTTLEIGTLHGAPAAEYFARCRFEGYDAAIASATQGSAPSWSGSAESVLQQTMSAMRGMLSPRSMSALSIPAEREISSPTLSPSTSFLGRLSTFGRSEDSAGDPVEEVTFSHQAVKSPGVGFSLFLLQNLGTLFWNPHLMSRSTRYHGLCFL